MGVLPVSVSARVKITMKKALGKASVERKGRSLANHCCWHMWVWRSDLIFSFPVEELGGTDRLMDISSSFFSNPFLAKSSFLTECHVILRF
jgi:hypothetical protein